jgi:hypothetical protein
MFFFNQIPNQQNFQQVGQEINKEELKNMLIGLIGQVSKDSKIKTVGNYIANIEVLPEYANSIDIFYNMLAAQMGAIGVDVTKYYLSNIEDLEKDMDSDYKRSAENILDNATNPKFVGEKILKTLAYLSKQINYKIINKQYKDEADKSVEIKMYGENAFILGILGFGLHSELQQMTLKENEDSPIKKDLNLLTSIANDRLNSANQKLKFNTPFGPLILTFVVLSENYRLLAEKDNAIDYIDVNEFVKKLKSTL